LTLCYYSCIKKVELNDILLLRKKFKEIEPYLNERSLRIGKAAPYRVYDLIQNKGWVSVGISSDTAEFAVNTISKWWKRSGKKQYSASLKILITADCGVNLIGHTKTKTGLTVDVINGFFGPV